MITQTGLLQVEDHIADESNDLWGVIGAVTAATAAAMLLAYCFQPLITLAYVVLLLAS